MYVYKREKHTNDIFNLAVVMCVIRSELLFYRSKLLPPHLNNVLKSVNELNTHEPFTII